MGTRRAVLFDLDDTLYDREAVVRQVVDEQYQEFRKRLGGQSPACFRRRILELDDHGYGDKPTLYRTVAAEWQLDCATAEAMLAHFWSSFYRQCRLDDDTKATLETLRERGLKVAVVTNGLAVSQNRKIACLGIAPLVDEMLVSDTEGLRKPDPAIFLRACQRCDALAAQSFFVGDHPEIDLVGARAAGLTAIWKRVPYRDMLIPGVASVDTPSQVLPLCLGT